MELVLLAQIERIQKSSNVVATLDVLNDFACIAEDYEYTMPKVDDEDEILIKDGRHPVIERMIDNGSFVENDTYLNFEFFLFVMIFLF